MCNSVVDSIPAPDPTYIAANPCVEELIGKRSAIRTDLLAADRQIAEHLPTLNETHRLSARNLWHYMAMRHHDIRSLQEQLAALGLSSLGRAESHVLASIDAVLHLLYLLAGRKEPPDDGVCAGISYAAGKRLLAQNTAAMLGDKPLRRTVRIMVTMPSEAATDYRLVRQMLASGMDCIRINCAHDDAEAWSGIIANAAGGHARRACGRDDRARRPGGRVRL